MKRLTTTEINERPPPVSRQLVHRSVAVWEFHRFHFLSILECRRLKNA